MKILSIKTICIAILAAGSLLAPAKPLKIYILAGQSNMTGMARNSTLEHIKMSPDTAKDFADLFDADGNPVELEQVRVSCWPKKTEQMGILKPGYGGGNSETMFGPEYGFGIYMHKRLQQPILIIKCGQGGRSLIFDFRPPSAVEWTPPAGHPDLKKPGRPMSEMGNARRAASHEYDNMINHVKNVLKDLKKYHPEYDETSGYEISGFAWFQGWNDMTWAAAYPNRNQPGGYDRHTWLLEHLIRDVRKDLNTPNMPFVIGVLGVNGIQDESTRTGVFQRAQAAVAENPEFKGTVAALHTGQFWDHELEELHSRANAIRRAKPEDKEKLKPLTPEEERIVEVGTSDGAFHYLGSGKIMAGIGKGFAASMLQLEAQKK